MRTKNFLTVETFSKLLNYVQGVINITAKQSILIEEKVLNFSFSFLYQSNGAQLSMAMRGMEDFVALAVGQLYDEPYIIPVWQSIMFPHEKLFFYLPLILWQRN